MPLMPDEKAQLAHVEQDLLRLFAQLSPATVKREVKTAVRTFSSAPVRTFVPVLVHRRVRTQLAPLRHATRAH